jgi:hypothetical protein
MNQFNEKTEGRKSRDTVPLSQSRHVDAQKLTLGFLNCSAGLVADLGDLGGSLSQLASAIQSAAESVIISKLEIAR